MFRRDGGHGDSWSGSLKLGAYLGVSDAQHTLAVDFKQLVVDQKSIPRARQISSHGVAF